MKPINPTPNAIVAICPVLRLMALVDGDTRLHIVNEIFRWFE